MKSLSHPVALLFGVLLALIAPVAGAQDAVEPIDTPAYLRVALERPVHFRTADGDAAPLPAGAYLAVVSPAPPLRLLPLAAGSRPWALDAAVTSHEEKLDVPGIESIPSGGDEHNLVLLFPDGTALDASGSYSGSVASRIFLGPSSIRTHRVDMAKRAAIDAPPRPAVETAPTIETRPPDFPTTPTTGVLSGLAAANELLALPWQALGRQTEHDAEQTVRDALEGAILANREERVYGVVESYSLMRLQVKNASIDIDLDAAPGFREVSPEGFTIELPRGGRWQLAVSGDIVARALVEYGGTRIFSWSPKLLHFGLRIMDFRVTAGAELDPAEPDRPQLVSAFIRPDFKVGGKGFIPISIPVQLEVEARADGAVSLKGPVANLPLHLGPIAARLTGQIFITLYPPVDVAIQVGPAQFPSHQRLDVWLEGTLTYELPLFGENETEFRLAAPSVVPALPKINELVAPLRASLEPPFPKVWGEGHPLGRTPEPEDGVDFRGAAEEIEAAIVQHDPGADIVSHLPWGAIFAVDHAVPPRIGLCKTDNCNATIESYGVEGDSAIWTGHYLAAEAFRYAATDDPAALERIRVLVNGVKRLFDVTQGIAIDDGRRVAVSQPGMLSRFARPVDDAMDFTDVRQPFLEDGQLGCYYQYSEGGLQPDIDLLPSGRVSNSPIQWYGWGCGGVSPFTRENMRHGKPVSRDQYSGIFMGLTYAHEFVPELRDEVRPMIERALDFLIANNWNVALPPDQRIATTFLGNFDKQLAFLLVGKHINPRKYRATYDRYAAASSVIWVPMWFSAVDPIMQYYKFNLGHIGLSLALFLEQHAGLRQNYMTAYAMLRRATAHHKNAYFNMLRILVERSEQRASIAAGPSGSNPDISLSDEIETLLGEWLERRERTAGPNGLPRNVLADFQYQAALHPEHVSTYTTIAGKTPKLAEYALPIWGRVGDGMDFMWQRQPFGVIAAGCILGWNPDIAQFPEKQQRGVLPIPDAEFRRECGNDARKREGAGVDYLLTYWMGAYLGILPL